MIQLPWDNPKRTATQLPWDGGIRKQKERVDQNKVTEKVGEIRG